MTDEPQTPPSDTLPPAGPDPLDDTQRIEVPRFAPTPDPRPDDRWAWASPGTQPGSERWYQPAQADPGSPATWSPSAEGAPTMPPVPPAFPGMTAVGHDARHGASRSRQRGGGGGAGIGTVLVASLLSAVLASSGTALVLSQTGALNRTPAATNTGNGQQTGGQQPVSIDESSAVIDAAASVSPAVVKITIQGQTTDPFGSVPTEGVGSGLIYDASGWILTNRHVVTGADKLTVELKDGRLFEGTVYGIDTLTDLAIVKVDATGLPTAPIGHSDGLKVGQLVVAIGSPLGTYSFSVTSGIVSGKGRDIRVDDGTRIGNLIQTDAAINPGNSGGPLVDAAGAVVGINTAVATDSSGIGFAIPIDIARPIMAQALAGLELSRPWIGIRFTTINLQVKQDKQLTVDNGALVSNEGGTGSAIVEGSPAAAAGLQDGDIILSINGSRLDLEHPLDAMLVQYAPNDTVELDVLRAGTSIKIPVTLGTRPGNL